MGDILDDYLYDKVLYPLHMKMRQNIVLGLTAGKGKILDAGCGVGIITKLLAEKFPTVYAIDIGKKEIARAKRENKAKNVHFAQMDITKTKFKPNFFDSIVCLEVIEHTDADKTLEEFRRILKKNGTLILSTPNRKRWQKRVENGLFKKYSMACWEHKQEFSADEFRALLEKHGFAIEEMRGDCVYPFFGIPFAPLSICQCIFTKARKK